MLTRVFSLLCGESFVRQHNDDLWAAMQPALRLVSKVLDQKPAFLSAAVRVWDRKIVQPFRDKRPPSSSGNRMSLHTFDLLPPEPVGLNPYKELDFLRTPYYEDLVDAMWEFIEDNVQWCVQGDPGCWAITSTYIWPRPTHARINQVILINADILMPLLEPSYSESEKLSASFVLASTMLHELAVSYSTILFFPFSLLSPPAPRAPFPLPGTIPTTHRYPWRRLG